MEFPTGWRAIYDIGSGGATALLRPRESGGARNKSVERTMHLALHFTPREPRFTVHDSRFTIHDSQFTIYDSPLTTYPP